MLWASSRSRHHIIPDYCPTWNIFKLAYNFKSCHQRDNAVPGQNQPAHLPGCIRQICTRHITGHASAPLFPETMLWSRSLHDIGYCEQLCYAQWNPLCTWSATAKQAWRAALVVRMKADAQQAIRSNLTARAMPSLARCARFGSFGPSHPCDASQPHH